MFPAGRGRLLAPDDDAGAAARPVAVISDAWWASRFGRDPAILGRLLTLNATSYAVVGVAPASFTGDSVGVRVDLWVPISRAPEVIIERPGALSDARSNWVRMIGRLQSGVSVEQARDAVAGRLEPDWTAAQRADVRINGLAASHGVSDQTDLLGRPIAILLAIVGVVLMLACANAAVLFLARMAAREQSIATRLALGARRGQILRLGLIEPLALTAIAGAIGGMPRLVGGARDDCPRSERAGAIRRRRDAGYAVPRADGRRDDRDGCVVRRPAGAVDIAAFAERALEGRQSLESRLVTLGRPRPGDPPDEPGTGADGVGRAVRANRS